MEVYGLIFGGFDFLTTTKLEKLTTETIKFTLQTWIPGVFALLQFYYENCVSMRIRTLMENIVFVSSVYFMLRNFAWKPLRSWWSRRRRPGTVLPVTESTPADKNVQSWKINLKLGYMTLHLVLKRSDKITVKAGYSVGTVKDLYIIDFDASWKYTGHKRKLSRSSALFKHSQTTGGKKKDKDKDNAAGLASEKKVMDMV